MRRPPSTGQKHWAVSLLVAVTAVVGACAGGNTESVAPEHTTLGDASGQAGDRAAPTVHESTIDLSAGLVAHYPLDGDATDVVTGERGALVGAAPTTNRSGEPDAALDFVAPGAHVVIEHRAELDVTNEFTISAWINARPPADPDLWYSVFEKSDPERGGHSRYGLWLHGLRPAACFEAADNSTQPCVEASEDLPPGEWHHIAAVRSGRRLILYLDGREVGNAFVGLHDVSRTPHRAFIGTDGYEEPTVWLDAVLDDIRLYDRALNPTEVAALVTEA